MKTYESISAQVPDTLLPSPRINLEKWSVIACDQYTSQPEYWKQVQDFIGDQPSTLNLVLPEIYLEDSDVQDRISKIHQSMRSYKEQGLLQPHNHMIYVERSFGEKVRHGIILALDLENYDYHARTKSFIRPTESTIVERIPPRLKVREGAYLELPHILILIDDPERTVIEPLTIDKSKFEKIYDFDLMMGGGHVCGYEIKNDDVEAKLVGALQYLADPRRFSKYYNVSPTEDRLLYAVGDGNHSMATAKAYWDKIKSSVGPDHPARYALVEIINIYDEGLEFEPIHRVLFGVKTNVVEALKKEFDQRILFKTTSNNDEMIKLVKEAQENHKESHFFGLLSGQGAHVVEIKRPTTNISVATIQPFLDSFLKAGHAEKIDYVHGDDVVCTLGRQANNFGFFLPTMQKSELFLTVIHDGALPRKTFSMGHAFEKRYYLECRSIT